MSDPTPETTMKHISMAGCGAATLVEAIARAADWIKELAQLQAEGFELTQRIGDDLYLHLEKKG